jgi:pimeloyl-ACP methyl ester carboxylesterase
VVTETLGRGPRVVLVHGSVGNAAASWSQQRALGERFRLALVTRSGYPPRPPESRIDFGEQADELAGLLERGDHLVGHSYGGVVCLLAAAARAELLGSLTVCEPPAFRVAREHPAVKRFMGAVVHAPREPRAYLEFFLPLVGTRMRVPPVLSPELDQGARAALAERLPSEAEVPFAELARAPFPRLVVSGAHNAALDAVCDVLERELGAERAVVPGAGHGVQRAPGFNDVLADFLDRAQRSSGK